MRCDDVLLSPVAFSSFVSENDSDATPGSFAVRRTMLKDEPRGIE